MEKDIGALAAYSELNIQPHSSFSSRMGYFLHIKNKLYDYESSVQQKLRSIQDSIKREIDQVFQKQNEKMQRQQNQIIDRLDEILKQDPKNTKSDYQVSIQYANMDSEKQIIEKINHLLEYDLKFNIIQQTPSDVEITSQIFDQKPTQDYPTLLDFTTDDLDEEYITEPVPVYVESEPEEQPDPPRSLVADLPYLVWLEPGTKSLHFQDLQTGVVSRHQLQLPFNWSSHLPGQNSTAWVMLSSTEIFLCGGYDSSNYWNNAYIYNVNTTKLSMLSSMKQQRGFHAVANVLQEVFVFGCFATRDLPQRTAEVYSLERGNWEVMQPIPVAIPFASVAQSNALLFIAGKSQTVIRFDPVTHGYASLPWILYLGTLHRIIAKEFDLYVLSPVRNLNVKTDGKMTTLDSQMLDVWCPGPSVLYQNIAYMAGGNEAEIITFDFCLQTINSFKSFI